MKANILNLLLGLLLVAALLGIVCGGFYFERWVNWKFAYGPKVEQRLQSLEQRIEKLEQHH